MNIKAYIRGIASYVPSRRVTNDELSKTVETDDEWIYSHTGIRARHIADAGEACSDLAYAAAKKALEDAGCPAAELDLIIVASITQDHIGFPSVACIIQDRLGAGSAAAMDISAACTGFVYGLETARAFIESGIYRNILVVGSEILTRIADWKDRNTCVLFGDGAGAAVVSAGTGPSGIIASYLASDGSGKDALIRPIGGTRRPISPDEAPGKEWFLQMDGRRVYRFAVEALGSVAEKLLKDASLPVSDVDYIVPHQANIRIIEACAKRLSLPMEKFYVNIDEFANTSAASIPIALADMKGKGLLKPGGLIVTVAFGGGLTYGGNIIRL